MKIIFYSLIIIGLILPIPLRAQDAPSRPLKDPGSDIEPTPLPKSSSVPTATPQATPHKVELSVPKPSPSPTPEPSQPPTPAARPERSAEEIEATPVKETATPSRMKARRRAKEKRSIEGQPEPVARATPLSRKDARVEAVKLKALEKEWEASFNDSGVIEKSLTDDFVGTSPSGKIMTKKALLREAKENMGAPPKTIARDLDVRFCAPDIAIVTGAAKQIDRSRAGQIVEHNYRFTDTWVQREGEWRCFSSQSMLVPR